ncbi:Aromatic di-alanine and TPR containing protein [Mycena sanguinolenta]|uniref:Aromatic di-alanine and TPR containing protein n=1 Tax=Mycena sanguinolenta TaxID=230812 RepID=A0A8H6XY23_9AGAR|nr:Aromatic di-alanine and TPR containing protein [Mycena sanguinolenta]
MTSTHSGITGGLPKTRGAGICDIPMTSLTTTPESAASSLEHKEGSSGTELAVVMQASATIENNSKISSIASPPAPSSPDAEKARHAEVHGRELAKRFDSTGDIDDIRQSVILLRQAVLCTPDNEMEIKANRWTNLGIVTRRLFSVSSDHRIADINISIEAHETGLSLLPPDHHNRALILRNLAQSFRTRFHHFNDPVDMDRSLLSQQQAIDLLADNDPDIAQHLDALGTAYLQRFYAGRNVEDVQNAIAHIQRARNRVKFGTRDYFSISTHLAMALTCLYEGLGQLTVIDEAVKILAEPERLFRKSDPRLPDALLQLSFALRMRFVGTGTLSDIDDAIRHSLNAISLLSINTNPRTVSRLHEHVSGCYFHRFVRLRDLDDLELAVSNARDSVKVSPKEFTLALPGRYTHLGSMLRCHYDATQSMDTIRESISCLRHALAFIPDDNLGLDRASCFEELGISHMRYFDKTGDPLALQEAVKFGTQAMNLTAESDYRRAGRLNNLSLIFHSSHEFDQAISCAKQALELLPAGHPMRPTSQINLASMHLDRFELSHDRIDLDDALHAYRLASTSEDGGPSVRFMAAQYWAETAQKYDVSEQLVDAFGSVICLIPQVIWLGSPVASRLRDIASIGDIVNRAAAVAIATGRTDQAVEWLEEGRAIIWRQFLQLRTPLDDLRVLCQPLADGHQRVGAALDHASQLMTASSSLQGESIGPTHYLMAEEQSRHHHELATEYERLLVQVRDLKGFESFLRPKTITELAPAARSGPVVLINVYMDRCDALILQDQGTIDHVLCEKTDYEFVEMMRSQLATSLKELGRHSRGIPDLAEEQSTILLDYVLGALWSHITKPVLKKIGFLRQQTSEERLPHLTWCTTGPLAFLPLHAAGDYRSKSCVYDFVVSSYTPTLAMLLKPNSDVPSVLFDDSVLLVSQPHTLGYPAIPGADRECNKVSQKFSKGTVLYHKAATVGAVLEMMNQHSCIHLACHGMQMLEDPSKSALILYDGPLELSRLMSKAMNKAKLAVLSACQTATGDKKLPDEAMHLVASFLAVGYPNVVGTMWSIEDDDAPKVAETFYGKLYTMSEEGG